MGVIGKVKNKLGRIAMNQIVGILLKKVAEGEFGPGLKALYWLVDGHKTQIGAIIMVPGILLLTADQSGLCTAFNLNCHGWATQWGVVLATLGGLGVHVGQVGGALKMDPPR